MQSFNLRSIARLATSNDPRALWFHTCYELELIRRRRTKTGVILPNTLYIETGSYCRERCEDCYVPIRDRSRHLRLSDTALGTLMRGSRTLPLDYVCIVGGEPLDDFVLDSNLRLVRDHPASRFLICTSGRDVCGDGRLKELSQPTNLSVVVSIDGFEETHDRMRGTGSHAEACGFLQEFSCAGGGLSGISVTLSGDNWREVASREFVEAACGMGAGFLSYTPCYQASARSPLSADDHARSLEHLMKLAATMPIQIFAPPFGQVFGGKLRANRYMRTLTVDYHGDIRTSHRGVVFGNIHHDDLMEVIASPELQASYPQLEGDIQMTATAL